MVSTFGWVAPLRPYLIGSSVLLLGYAWWLRLRPQKVDECGCEVAPRRGFLGSTTFLSVVTALAVVLTTFPLYASWFVPSKAPMAQAAGQMTRAEIEVKGMTCTTCEMHVSAELQKVRGVVDAVAHYAEDRAVVTYDPSIVRIETIMSAVDSSGYEAVSSHILENAQ
jgi:copper chaperone CopZ